MHEAENGNLKSGAQLLRGIPIMLMADLSKAMLTGGGSLPGYMANWTMADWLSHAMNRSGFAGTSQFGLDLIGGDIANTLGGPTIGHASSVMHDLAAGEVGKAVTSSIPIVKQFAAGVANVARAVAE